MEEDTLIDKDTWFEDDTLTEVDTLFKDDTLLEVKPLLEVKSIGFALWAPGFPPALPWAPSKSLKLA